MKLTLASGVRVDDPVVYSQLFRSGRKLLPGYFKDAGWRAVDIMPGTKKPAPEARAWGFDRALYASERVHATAPPFVVIRKPASRSIGPSGACVPGSHLG